jgi:hypothetical protein
MGTECGRETNMKRFNKMFRSPPAPSSPPPPLPEQESPAWADGFFYLIRQSLLDFGRNRKEPKPWRPALTLIRAEPAVQLLPATTQSSNPPDFFEVQPEEALFAKQQAKRNFLYYKYETLPAADLGNKIGMVSHKLRLDIMAWIVKRYVEE